MSSTVSAVAAAASSSSSSSSSSHTGPRGTTATEDGEDEDDEMMAAIHKLLTQPSNDEERQFIRTAKTYIAKQGGPKAFLQRSGVGTNTTLGRNGPVGGGSFLLVAPVQLPPIPPFTYNDTNTRVMLTRLGFDPDNLNKKCDDNTGSSLVTPMLYYSYYGNVAMVRYLLSRDADGRKADRYGASPMYHAAYSGHLEIVQLLSRDGGAHEDIWRLDIFGRSPLNIALDQRHFNVVYWLILIGALAPRNDDDGGLNDAIMRRDLRPRDYWRDDKREPVLAWARDAVTTHDNDVQLLFAGMIASSKRTASPLAIFDGKFGILKLIADYGVTGLPQQLRTLRQLMVLLPAFIDDTPFVEYEEDEEDY